MVHRDTGFRPKLGVEGYRGLELWEYDIGPQQKNDGEVDGDVDFEELLGGTDEIVDD